MNKLTRALKDVTHLLLWPTTSGLRWRDRIVWPLQLGQWAVAAALVVTAFVTAGGDLHHPLTNRHPAAFAALIYLFVAVVAWLVEAEARTSERRLSARAERIRVENERLSLQTPYRLQAAERAVLVTAFGLAHARIPTEHPEQDSLVDAVTLLRTSIDRGDAVHPDIEEIYLHVFGTRLNDARHAVAELVREHGPIGFVELAAKLREGGPGRPALMVGRARLAVLLRDAHDTKKPASWLAPRRQGEPYQHRENLPARV